MIAYNATEDSVLGGLPALQIGSEIPFSSFSPQHFYLSALLGLGGVLWYLLFWKRFDWYRDLTELGFDEIHKSAKHKHASNAARTNAINELRQRRKLGDIPPVYPNGWFVALESDELAPGKAKEVNMLDKNLVAWRGESGVAYIADAYCPHLGAHLGVGSTVAGECIQCPFHGWSFKGSEEGKLASIPYTNTLPRFAKLSMWKTVEMNGFVYVWFHAENEEPSWMPVEFPQVRTGAWKYRGRSEFKVGCHIQEIPENGADIAHLNVVHDSAMFCGGQPQHALLKWHFLKHVWSGSWNRSDAEGEGHVAIMKVSHALCLFNKIRFLEVNVEVKQCGPGTVSMEFKSILGRGVLFHSVTPIQPFVQRVLHRFYSESTFVHPFGKLVLLGEAVMIERDISIWNRKMFIAKPIFVKEDQSIKKFRAWYAQFYSEHSPRYNENGNALDF